MPSKLAVNTVLFPRQTHNRQFRLGLNWYSRGLVVAGVLILSVSIALWSSERVLIATLGLIFGAALLGTFLNWPPVGLLALVATSLVVPIEISTGTYTTLNPAVLLLLVLTLLWILGLLARKGVKYSVPERSLVALFGFLVVAALSFGAGQLGWIDPHRRH